MTPREHGPLTSPVPGSAREPVLGSRIVAASNPPGWARPGLELHRRWHARRALALRARLALALLVPLVAAVWLGAPAALLALALAGLALPVAPSPMSTLREIERRHGEAYTTALVAPPDDRFGIAERLRRQADVVAGRAELPGLPLPELLAAVAIASLVLVLPAPGAARASLDAARPAAVAPPRDRPSTDAGPAEPVLDAPTTAAAPDGGRGARPGRAASGGTPAESNVGPVRPGSGTAESDPDAVTRDFLEALERGAVRGRPPRNDGGGATAGPAVEDQDAAASGGSGSGTQGGQDGRGGQDGTGARAPKPGGGAGQRGAPGGTGGPPGDGPAGAGSRPPSASDQGPSRRPPAGTAPRADGTRDPAGGQLDEGGAGPGGRGDAQPGSGDAGREGNATGARGARGTATRDGAEIEARGKLEYLPGAARGTASRSGALQLPGDPRRPLTGDPSSAEYRRALEAAVLDPRLPPEYQELLRNYYR